MAPSPEAPERAAPPALVRDAAAPAGPAPSTGTREGGFRVEVGDFEGPFDLLLSLIARHEMEVTRIALSRVTDEFLSYLHTFDADEHDVARLEAASRFVVVAATLLDLKAASLLPHGDLVDAEDVAALEAQDLLFARLLQYRAFKDAGLWLAARFDQESTRHERAVPVEERFRTRVPDLLWRTSPEDLAVLAALALTPTPLPVVSLQHLHAPAVSVRRQAGRVVDLLRSGAPMTFRELIEDASGPARPGIVVARFVAILELYRQGAVGLDQEDPLGDLTVRWIAGEWDDAALDDLGADYD